MGTIRLHPDDCAKYGAPEEIEFNLAALGVRQRSALEKASKRSVRWMFDQLAGVPELDEHGNPIPVPVIDRETGEQKVESGEPVYTEKLARDGEAVAMLVWAALWGIGIRPPWNTFDVQEFGLQILAAGDDEDDDDDSGKAEEPEMESSTTS